MVTEISVFKSALEVPVALEVDSLISASGPGVDSFNSASGIGGRQLVQCQWHRGSAACTVPVALGVDNFSSASGNGGRHLLCQQGVS